MKLAGHTMGTPEYSVFEALRLFRKIGLDGAELIVQDGYGCALPERCSDSVLADIRYCARSLGLRVIALTPYYSKFNDLDEMVRQKEIDGILNVIRYAECLGAEYIRIYGGNFAQSDTDPDGRKRKYLVESMRYLGGEAKKSGVRLAIENHFNTMTVSAADTISIIREIDHDFVGILYDQANLVFTEQEPFETAIQLQKDKIFYTHVKSLSFKENRSAFISSDVSHPKEEERNVVSRIVGEGDMDWQAILTRLTSVGYDGWLSFEYERRWHPNDLPDASIGMRKSAENVRLYISKIHTSSKYTEKV